MKHSSDLIRSFCRSSIKSKKQKPKVDSEGELDILTVAMDSGAFSDEELVDQMMTFLAAGTLTSSFRMLCPFMNCFDALELTTMVAWPLVG